MYNASQNELLIAAVELLEQADALIQKALGQTDVCYETCTQIQNVVDDLLCDIQEHNAEVYNS